MNKKDFAPFTKEELVDFILKNRFFEDPLYWLWRKRLDEIDNKIDKNLEKAKGLTLLPNGTLQQTVQNIKEYDKNYEEYQRLCKERAKIDKILFGDK